MHGKFCDSSQTSSMDHHNCFILNTNSKRWVLWAKVMLLFSAALPSSGISLGLQPSVDRIYESDTAVFNCSYSCTTKFLQTHTIYWLVGDAQLLTDRSFVRREEHLFTARSGLQVEVEDISTCGNGTSEPRAIEQLRINGSSAELYNRTAIQCVAIPRSNGVMTLYSSYSLMLIDGPVEASSPTLTTSAPSNSEAVTSILPSPTSAPICQATLTHTKSVTVTVTAVNLSPTSLPDANAIGQITGVCSASVSKYSLVMTSWLLMTLSSQLITWTIS